MNFRDLVTRLDLIEDSAQASSNDQPRTDREKLEIVKQEIDQFLKLGGNASADNDPTLASTDGETDGADEDQVVAESMYESLVESFGYVPESKLDFPIGLAKGLAKGVGKLFGKSAGEIAKEIGPRVETIGANGEKQIWKATGEWGTNKVVYELEGSVGKNSAGKVIAPEDLAKLNPKPIERATPQLEKPRVTVKPGETMDDAIARTNKKSTGGREEPTLDKGTADSVGSTRPGMDKVKDTKVEPTLNKGNADPVGLFKPGMDLEEKIPAGDPVKITGKFIDWSKTERPDLYKELSKMTPAQKASFSQAVGKKLKTAGYLTLAILIALAIYWIWKHLKSDDDKVEPTANAGSKTSEGGAPVGATLPGDYWHYLGYPALQGSALTKNKDGMWETPQGRTATDPKLIAKIESLVPLTPEERQDKITAETSIFLYYPSGGGGEPEIATGKSAPVPTTTWGAR